MRIAILYICTGNYTVFFDDFYKSAERYFLPNDATKEYFVFTDDMQLSNAPGVHLVYRRYHGFPDDSLFRFDMFLQIEEQLSGFDYTFFFNANMLFVAPVGREFLPVSHDLLAVLHPGYYSKSALLYPYEIDKRSKAYVAPYKGHYHYYMGGLNGGKTAAYLELVRTLSKHIHYDFERGIVATFHDESHINRYLRDVVPLKLSPAYGYPEGWKLPFKPIIILRDKVRANPLCTDFTKHRKHSLVAAFQKALGYLWHATRWLLCI